MLYTDGTMTEKAKELIVNRIGIDDIKAAICPPFSTSTAYTAGQYVWHDGKLYRFTTDHAAGSWNAAQVELAVVANAIPTVDDTLSVQGAAADAKKTGDEIADLKSEMNTMQSEIEDFYITDERAGNYFALNSSDGSSAVANSDVTIGNKNMIVSAPQLNVGQQYSTNLVSYMKASDGTIAFNGTASSNLNINIAESITNLPAGKYTLSGCPTRATGEDFMLAADYWVGTSRATWLRDYGNGATGTLPANYSKVSVWFTVYKNSSIDGTLKPQLELAESATTYVQSANQSVAANTSFPITGEMAVFAHDSFTLSVKKNGTEETQQRLTDAENAIDAIEGDIDGINDNIDAVETEVAQNKEALYDPYPMNTLETSQIVTCTDGADKIPVKAATVNIAYSSTPKTSLRLFVTGENMFDIDEVTTKNFITKGDDGTLTPNGSQVSIYSGLRGSSTAVPSVDIPRLPFLPAGTYYVNSTGGELYLATVNPSTGYDTGVTVSYHMFTLAADALLNIRISDSVSNIIIAPASQIYTPFIGKTYKVPFVDTEDTSFSIYGGTVDLVNGIATELYNESGDELETPVTHNITPIEVKSCLGRNYIWSDCTSVFVTYRADIKMYVDQRNKSDALEQYNIDASVFGNVRNELFLQEGANVIAVAHRGLSNIAPENTLPAYKAAKTAGFLVAETDVDWTSDGVPVLLHDPSINRTARNADGTSLSSTVYIKNITYAEALTYDFGIYRGEQFAGTKIPTFEQFISLCKNLGLMPYIELKLNTQTAEQTQILIQTVIEYGMINRVAWLSNYEALLLQVLAVHQTANVQLIASELTSGRIAAVNNIKSIYPAVNLTLCCQASSLSVSDYETIKGLGVALNVWVLDTVPEITAINPYVSSVTSNALNAATVLREAELDN